MSGVISYNILIDVAKTRGLDNYEDLLIFTDLIENEINIKREKEKSN